MDNLSNAKSDPRAYAAALRNPHTWILSFIYIGTFGSFIGFSFAFGQVLLVQFPQQFPTPVMAAALTFLGPLLGSLLRPVGGWASVNEGTEGPQIWDVIEAHVRKLGSVRLEPRTTVTVTGA